MTLDPSDAWVRNHLDDDSPFSALARYYVATDEVSPFSADALDEARSVLDSLLDTPKYEQDLVLFALREAIADAFRN